MTQINSKNGFYKLLHLSLIFLLFISTVACKTKAQLSNKEAQKRTEAALKNMELMKKRATQTAQKTIVEHEKVTDSQLKMPLVLDNREQINKEISEQIKIYFRYPEACRLNNEQARIYLSFDINKKGKTENIEIMRYTSLDSTGKESEALKKEAIRVVKSFNLSPPLSRGRPRKTEFTLPITFRIQ